ncbi:phytanoyl-CoA dioxygenase family protein [Pelagicoccus mobilis]|uniref:Phytanoyl-CoA dioxygenase family protein n=1 Tax=Pelagicoccus mobilis TaxID=415221 RepID=A0A934RW56_9BACT|nr:phytanoyl-CoA dioxygenase family protein [Pelagicoccus mobilis]MBK1875517.1 phytanoyl-CoA dioxygenase family protein [Pelagicoccus mobilis]
MITKYPERRDIEISEEHVSGYRRDGFVKVSGILTKEEADFYYQEALGIATANNDGTNHVLNQKVNVWRESEIMKSLTFHPNVVSIAKRLAGVPLRLWHDQLLAKNPRSMRATEWHQDQPYWPHRDSPNPISIWIALCDVPVRKGSMSFIPGQQHRAELGTQVLEDSRSLFAMAPDLEYEPKITLPLRAGDCTFHHGCCPHMANPNETDEYRLAHVAIFVDQATLYDPTVPGKASKHILTDPLGLEVGTPLAGEFFPEI